MPLPLILKLLDEMLSDQVSLWVLDALREFLLEIPNLLLRLPRTVLVLLPLCSQVRHLLLDVGQRPAN